MVNACTLYNANMRESTVSTLPFVITTAQTMARGIHGEHNPPMGAGERLVRGLLPKDKGEL